MNTPDIGEIRTRGIALQRVCPGCGVRLAPESTAVVTVAGRRLSTVLICCAECINEAERAGRMTGLSGRYQAMVAVFR